MVQATFDEIIDKHTGDSGSLMKVLRDIQSNYEWLPVEALQQVSKRLELPLTKTYRTAIFGKDLCVIPRNHHPEPVAPGVCIVDLIKYYLDFLQHDLCGKCIMCLEGMRQMYNIMSDITQGKGKEGDIELLEEVGRCVTKSSACNQGPIVAQIILTAVDDFRDQFEAHLNGNCPTGTCTSLLRIHELVGQRGE